MLDQAGGDGDAPGTVVISAIGGTAGVGKTALAVHWAHQVARAFPDGQLYVEPARLRPHREPGDARPRRSAGSWMRWACRAERIPPGLDAQAGLYRSLLAGRRMLIVLDNARDAQQVRPLLPGAARAAWSW